MAANYIATNGQDLDDVFDPYFTGSSPASTGFVLSSGVDLNTRYAPIVFGSVAITTGLQISNGSDLNTLFAAKGTAAYWNGTLAPLVTNLSDTGNSIGTPALAEVIFRANGDIITRNNYPFTETILGKWSASLANSSNTEIRFDVLSGALTENGAPDWRQVNAERVFDVSVASDGTLSALVRVRLRGIGFPSSEITKDIALSATFGEL